MKTIFWRSTAIMALSLMTLSADLLWKPTNAISLVPGVRPPTEASPEQSAALTTMEKVQESKGLDDSVIFTPKKDRDNVMRSVEKLITMLEAKDAPSGS